MKQAGLPVALGGFIEQVRRQSHLVIGLRQIDTQPAKVRGDIGKGSRDEGTSRRGSLDVGNPNPSWIEVRITASHAANRSATDGCGVAPDASAPRRKRHPSLVAAASSRA
jgi:hypothetical protein